MKMVATLLVLLVFLVPGVALVACTEEEAVAPTPTPAAESTPSLEAYEQAVLDWLFNSWGPTWVELKDLLQELGESPRSYRLAVGEILADLYQLRDVASQLPSLEPPALYKDFDLRLRRATDIIGEGIDMIFEGLESEDSWKVSTGLELVFDGTDDLSEAPCFVPSFSPLYPGDEHCSESAEAE